MSGTFKKYLRLLVNIYRSRRAQRATCLITTFKDRFELMEFFVNYYSRYWKIRKFVFLMGYTGLRDVELIKERIARIAPHTAASDSIIIPDRAEADMSEIVYAKAAGNRGGVSIDLLRYRHPRYVEVRKFNDVALPLARKIALAHLDAKYSRIFLTDNDEFYYSPSPGATLLKGWEIFHFMEYVPHDSFSADKDWRWCVQGWYHNPRLKEVFKKGLFCRHCKYLKFARAHCRFGHCGNNEGGGSCRDIRSTPAAKLNLLKEDVCFHLSVRGKEELAADKLQQGYVTSESNFREEAVLFKEPPFPVITENFLKKYYAAKPQKREKGV